MKILYVTTVDGTMNFFVDHFKMLKDEGNQIELATNTGKSVLKEIFGLNLKIHNISFSRNPFCLDNIRACFQLKKIINEENYDVVHCHTPNAAAITRLVCRSLRKKGLKVFYTAHGFHFYKDAPLKNWLLYFPIEWICAHWTDVLITINTEDYSLAKRRLKAKQIGYIRGVGLDIDKFALVNVDKDKKRRELDIQKEDFVFVSVGELNENKNHMSVISALAELRKEIPINNIKYLICGVGILESKLQNLINENNLEDNVKLLGFRRDVSEIYKVSDFFIFPSFREGLSVALMEAMANKLPVMCSEIRGNTDLIDKKGGLFFRPADKQRIKDILKEVIVNRKDNLYNEKLQSMGLCNLKKVQLFNKENILVELKKIYDNIEI